MLYEIRRKCQKALAILNTSVFVFPSRRKRP